MNDWRCECDVMTYTSHDNTMMTEFFFFFLIQNPIVIWNSFLIFTFVCWNSSFIHSIFAELAIEFTIQWIFFPKEFFQWFSFSIEIYESSFVLFRFSGFHHSIDRFFFLHNHYGGEKFCNSPSSPWDEKNTETRIPKWMNEKQICDHIIIFFIIFGFFFFSFLVLTFWIFFISLKSFNVRLKKIFKAKIIDLHT